MRLNVNEFFTSRNAESEIKHALYFLTREAKNSPCALVVSMMLSTISKTNQKESTLFNMTESKMAANSEVVHEYMLEDKIVDIWPNFPCLLDVLSPDFKDRDKRQNALESIAKEVNQTGMDYNGLSFSS